MEVQKQELKDSLVKLTIAVEESTIADAKKEVIEDARKDVKAAGFRQGQAPDKIVEKQIGDDYLQNQVIDYVVNSAYVKAIKDEKVAVIGQPAIKLTKFVPYTELEFEAEVEVTPEFKLPDYKKLSVKRTVEDVTDKEVEEVLDNLATRGAESKEVKRAAKDADKVWIDFKGVDKDGKEVSGASGEDYPLVIGSNTFIKGFEPEVVGLKAGDEKTFDVIFPKDYHVKALQNKPVTFTITVKKIEEVVKPKIDDAFAGTVGPFTKLADLKADIKKQLEAEKNNKADSTYREELVGALVEKSKFDIPPKLKENVKNQLRQELMQNLQYRGMTLEQFRDAEGYDEKSFETDYLDDRAVKRAKASIVLTEVAEAEDLKVTTPEIDQRIALLKQRYTDEKMQAELDKPDARREVAAQMLTEKTIDLIVESNTKHETESK
ncbi:TPA: trigger factor [Candidatus Saccharibacteria bacterium]|nr:trigger factor [Candidatus Saccharibacteria bacterium]HIO87419.1 trigger factor [Candidatus Saccharibacteria bacterium]